MVSFQCNGCGDVLTKPKLDKHRAVCHTSFDCIDCSKRFESPADYKGHTSCISEAEKYQKALYSGGKQSGPETNGQNHRSRQQGGGRQWGNNRPQWQQRNVNKATGANDTPLGTPVRMSPVNDIPVVEENTQNTPAAKTPMKRKAESEITESNDTSEPTKKKKRQKNGDGPTEATVPEVKSGKKRKSTLEVAMTESPPQCPDLQSVKEAGVPGEGGEKKEKKKKEKKREKAKEVMEGEKEERKKEKRKKKEDSSLSGQEPPVTETLPPIDTEKTSSTKKKSKSKAKVVDETPDVVGPKPPQPIASEVTGARDDRTDRKKNKKRQSGNHLECNGDGERVVEGNEDGSKEKRKEKKKKRRSEGQVVVSAVE